MGRNLFADSSSPAESAAPKQSGRNLFADSGSGLDLKPKVGPTRPPILESALGSDNMRQGIQYGLAAPGQAQIVDEPPQGDVKVGGLADAEPEDTILDSIIANQRQTLDPPEKDGVASSFVKGVQNAPERFMQSAIGMIRGAAESGASAPTQYGAAPGSMMMSANDPSLMAAEDARARYLKLTPEKAAEDNAAIKAKANDPQLMSDVADGIHKKLQSKIDANQPNVDRYSIAGLANSIGESGALMVPTIALGAVNPVMGMAQMAVQVGGQQYGESRTKGRSVPESYMDAGVYAASEALTELPLLKLIGEGGKSAITRALKGTAIETAGEGINQVTQSLYDAGVDPNKTMGEILKTPEFYGDIGMAMAAGGVLGGAAAIATAPFAPDGHSAETPGSEPRTTPEAEQVDTSTTPQADAALQKLSDRADLNDNDRQALIDAGYANAADNQYGIEMTETGDARFRSMDAPEQPGAAQTPNTPMNPEVQDDQEASQRLLDEQRAQLDAAVESPEAQTAQQRDPGGRLERRAGHESQPDPAEQSQQLGTDTPSTEGVFDPTAASRESLARTAPVDIAARDAAESPDNDRPTPTDAQKEAGSYKKGHVRLSGLDVAIENPNGSVRSGTDRNGKKWRRKMVGHYGAIRGTQSNDGENIDVFIKPGTQDADTAYVVDQHNDDGSFDESKVILGSDSIDDARKTYRANYPDDWQGDKTITAMPIDQFKDWIKHGDLTQPAAPARKAPPKSMKKADRDARKAQRTAAQTPRAAFYANPDNAGIDHEQAVQDAVARGERVSPDVLVDYPDLATPAAATDNEDTTPSAGDNSTPTSPRAPKSLTRGMRSDLSDLGYEKPDIDGMRPDIAAEVIAEQRRKPGAAVTKSEKSRARIDKMRRIDNQNDDIITAVRKLGGINTDLESDWRGRLSHLNSRDKRLGLPGIERKGGAGLSLDQLTEKLAEEGYIGTPNDAHDQSELADLLSRAESGTPVYGNAPAADALDQQAADFDAAQEQPALDELPDTTQQETGSPTPPLPDDGLEPVGTGQAFAEDAYRSDWGHETRALSEWFEAAAAYDPDAAEDILSTGANDATVARRLIEVANNGRREEESARARRQGAGESDPGSDGRPPAADSAQAPDATLDEPGQAPGFSLQGQEQPQAATPTEPTAQTDLLGDDTRDAQAVADEARRRDARRNGEDVPADIDGGLFANKTRDIEDAPRMSRSRVAQTDTEAFKRWLGDSKVVDANGKPLVVYHGTNADFTRFDDDTRGKATRATSSIAGHFFASTPRTAKAYADQAATSAPVTGLIDRANKASARGDEAEYDRLIEEADRLESEIERTPEGRMRGQNIMPVYLSIQNPLEIDAKGENPEGIGGIDPLIQRAKREGRDGVIIRNFDDAAGLYDEIADHYIAFRPEQIKSATGNRGTFDPNDPDIRASRGTGSSNDPSPAVSSTPTDQDTADVDTLRTTLENYLGREDIDLRVAENVPADSASAARNIAPLFGKRVVFYETTDPQVSGFNGLALPGSDVVYLNVDAEVAHTALLGHELTHYMARERPDLWQQLRSVAESEMQNSDEYRAWLDRVMGSEGRTAGNEELHEEMIADFIGDQFLKPSFWTNVMEQSEPGVARKIAATLRRFLDNVLQWLNQRGFGGSRYFKDIQRMREAAASAFAGYARSDETARSGQQSYAASRERDPAATASRTSAPDSFLPDKAEAEDFRAALGKSFRSLKSNVPPIKVASMPPVLKALGVRDVPIVISRDVVRKATNGVKHNVPMRIIEQLPEEISDPVAVFQSSTQDNAFVIMTEQHDQSGAPVVVALDVRQRDNQFDVTRIASTYGRRGTDPFASWVRDGLLRYKSKRAEKSPGLKGLQLPNSIPGDVGPERTVLNESDIQSRYDTPRFSRSADKGGLAKVSDETMRKAGLRPDNRSLAGRVAAYFDQPANAIKDDIRAATDAAKQGLFDRFHAIKTAEQSILGGNLPAEQSAYVAARLSTGTSSVMHAVLLYGAPEVKGGIIQQKSDTQGLLGLLAPVRKDMDAWLGWMVGRRAQRLMDEGRENNFTQPEIDELLSLSKGKEKQFKQVADEYNAFKTSILDVAEASGLIDAETRPAWDMADHIPFYRSDSAQDKPKGPFKRKGLSHQDSGIRQLRGGEGALNDPLENIILNFTHLIDSSLKNEAMRRAVINLEGSDYIEPVGRKFSPVTVSMDSLRKSLEAEGVDISSLPDDVITGMRRLLSMHPPQEKDVARVMIDGKPKFYRINDAQLLKALTSIDEKALPLGMFRGFKRLLTGSITADPSFIMRNFMRDSLHSWVISEDAFIPMVDSARGLKQVFTEDENIRAMMFSGASFTGGYLNANQPGEIGKAIRRALRSKGYSASATNKFMSTVLDTPAKVWETYRDVGDAVENSNRAAVVDRALKAGKSKAQAVYEGKDLMDFSMRGSWVVMQALNDMVPFLNARMQGLYKLGRAGAFPGRKMALSVAMRGSVIMAATLALYAINKDDDRYEELEDWDKDMFWHFWIGDAHYRWPKPFEIGLLYGMIPERMARAMSGRDDPEKTFDRFLFGITQTLSFNPTPQLVQPAVELWANKSFFTGRGIESMRDEGVTKEYRYSPYTSDTARWASKLGGSKANLSPKQIQHLIEGYGGTMASYALSVSDLAIRWAEGAPVKPARTARDIPFVNSLYRGKAPPYRTRFITELYDVHREAEQIYRTVNDLDKKGEYEQADKLDRENSLLLDERKYLGDATRDMADINADIRDVYQSRKMTAVEKRKEIESLQVERNQVAQDEMQAFEKEKAATQR